MSVFLLEKKSEFWPVAFDGVDKVRLQPTIAKVLDAARPSTMSKGEQMSRGALKVVLIEGIMSERLHDVYATLGGLLGMDPTVVKSAHVRDVEPESFPDIGRAKLVSDRKVGR